MNESYAQPDLKSDDHDSIIKGMYAFSQYRPQNARGSVHLLGSGAIFREVIAASELLSSEWLVASDVWSVTSFSELARQARETERHNRLHPDAPSHRSYVATCLARPFPIIAATDYVASYAALISPYVHQPFVTLGTDGFGRSDTRDALRRFFEVDRHHIVVAALNALAERGKIARLIVADAVTRYGIDPQVPPPWAQ